MAKEIIVENMAFDNPDSRDYSFENFVNTKNDVEGGEILDVKWPREELIVQDQKQTKACTVFGATHIHNGLNILEDKVYGKTRTQTQASMLWNKYCTERNNFNSGSDIQTIAKWFKKNNLIAGYVSIPNNTPQDKMVLQMKQSIDMGLYIYGGSAFGNWSKIGKTGIYEESNPKNFLGHGYGAAVDYVLKDDGTVDYFWAINSRGPTRGQFKGYFKIYAKDVTKLYTKIIFIDKDDKEIFDKLQEVEKLKQGLKLLREVYNVADDDVKRYFETIKLGENFSRLYETSI